MLKKGVSAKVNFLVQKEKINSQKCLVCEQEFKKMERSIRIIEAVKLNFS